jgi:phosphonopyruvate decarboxylase
LKRYDAIGVMLGHLDDRDIALFTTGMIGREAFSCRERRADFYMIGSMGLASAVGLGIALNTSRRVFVFDGDGSLLMDMGTMAMIGAEKPGNFYHVVLDNGVYQSTGGQPTRSGSIDLCGVARAAGYAFAVQIRELAGLKALGGTLAQMPGPVFLQLKVEPGGMKEIPRVAPAPEDLTRRIREALQ